MSRRHAERFTAPVCAASGFPWALILTPVQITRNTIGMCAGPDPSRPSAELRKFMQVRLGAKMIQASRQNAASAPPIIPR
jgi:hypothetical protein